MFHIIKSKKQKQELLKHQELKEKSEKFLDMMATKQHEFSKHLQVLKGMSANKGISKLELEKYIEGLLDRREYEIKTVYSGDGAISALLSEKKKEAYEKGILFDSFLKKPLPIFPCSRYDLIEILGNLINNAFDAVEGLEEANKKVFLVIGSTAENTFIQVLNGIPTGFILDMDQMMQKGFSTKKGGVRGFGLHNTKNIVQENNGKLEISINEELI